MKSRTGFSKNKTETKPKRPAGNSAVLDLSHQTIARKYPSPDVKYLYGAAAGRCAFPNCRKHLLLPTTNEEKAKQIGRIAHIIGHADSGPRGDANYPREKLDTYDNWILLCPTCHEIVDAQPERYTPDFLRQLKNEHEQWVNQMLPSAMANATFAELEVAVKGIMNQSGVVGINLSVIPPEKKIKLNQLSLCVRNKIVLGLMQSPMVQSFFVAMEKADGNFEKRLVKGFQEEYLRLRNADEISDDLWRFAGMNKTEPEIQAAGLALLSHLFEKCDIFEKTEEELQHAPAN